MRSSNTNTASHAVACGVRPIAAACLFVSFLAVVACGGGGSGGGAIVVPPPPSGGRINTSLSGPLTFTNLTPQTFTVDETGYSGAFTAQSSDTNVAVVSAASGSSFTVTPVAGGTATIDVSDSIGHSDSVPVTVDGATLTTQLRH